MGKKKKGLEMGVGVGALLLLFFVFGISIGANYYFFSKESISWNVKAVALGIGGLMALLLSPTVYKNLNVTSNVAFRAIKALATSVLIVGLSVGFIVVLIACAAIDNTASYGRYNRYSTSLSDSFISLTGELLSREYDKREEQSKKDE